MKKIAALALTLFAAAGGVTPAERETSHGGAGQHCQVCHLTSTGDAARGETMLFTTDLVSMCVPCHRDAQAMSHPVNFPASRGVPAPFVTDWRGWITCVTCHRFHDNRFGLYLRAGWRGKELCFKCHDMAFFRRMKDTGESLRRAHLSQRAGKDDLALALDGASLACLDCHDGSVTVEMAANIRGSAAMAYVSRSSSHPIGMDYRAAARDAASYHPVESLPPEVALPSGKVGCVSCHAPYKDRHGQLALSNARSGLCMSCHKL